MKLFFICLLLFFFHMCYGQNDGYSMADTSRIMDLLTTANIYNFSKADSGLVLSEKALDIAKKLHFRKGEALALHAIGEAYTILGDFPRSLKNQFDALTIYKEMGDKTGEAMALTYIGNVYVFIGEYREALPYFFSAVDVGQRVNDHIDIAFSMCNIGDIYDSLRLPDSALYYQKHAYQLLPIIERPHLRSFILVHMGNIYAQFGKNDSAIKYYLATILNSIQYDDHVNLSMAQRKMSNVYGALHRSDSSLYYAQAAFFTARNGNATVQLYDASKLLATLFRNAGKFDSAFFYSDVALASRDSIYGPEKFRQLQVLLLHQQQSEQTIVENAERFKNQIKYTFLFIALGIFGLLATILIRNNRQKQKANELLSEQKIKVEDSLTELKSTQTQLVQREKMASLGEVTAGIAHEIQNPLNFINNFSEINQELIEEASLAKKSGDQKEHDELLAILKDNQQKINHHGRRADSIVKAMLQHARSGAGKLELTDLNALADEYLRVAYHGICAKEKSFHANLQADFDPTIGKIDLIPEDIGRVLFNLYNNAFYALNERKINSLDNYEPALLLTTRKKANMIFITVKDNGTGIPQKVIDKIFQPFFTTRPTGQGTGLGLSLSYDIVKAHGGEIKVESKEGEGAEFVVAIPAIKVRQ